MNAWKLGDRVEHGTFGTGTVIEVNDQHTVVHFDDYGRKRFASHLVVLTVAVAPEPRRAIQEPAIRGGRKEAAAGSRVPVAGVPSSVDQLVELARRKVRSKESLNEFVSAMRMALAGPGHPHIGVLSGMRVQQFQNWLLDENRRWQLTDAQLLAVMRVEFALAAGQVHVGDVDTGLQQVAGIRAHYNRDGHNDPSPASRHLPPSKSYGTF